MKKLLCWALVLSPLFLQAAPDEVRVAVPKPIDYPTYRSFAWWPLPPLRGIMKNEEIRDDIQSVIIDVLSDKNIEESFLSLRPSFYVAYYAEVKGKAGDNAHVLYPDGYSGLPFADKNETVFIIDFIRPESKIIFWHGVAPFKLDRSRDKEDQIDAVVKKILAQYPGRTDK